MRFNYDKTEKGKGGRRNGSEEVGGKQCGGTAHFRKNSMSGPSLFDVY